jgi:hypothetical protein
MCRILVTAAYEPVHPSVHDLAAVLKEHGYKIVFVGLECFNPLGPSMTGLGIYDAIHELDAPRWLDGLIGSRCKPRGGLYKKLVRRSVRGALRAFPKALLFPRQVTGQMRQALGGADYDFVIAIDKGGMGLASALGGVRDIYYYSLELYTKTDIVTRTYPLVGALWNLERRNAGLIRYAVIQDKSRWQVLKEDLDLTAAHPVYLPVSEFPAKRDISRGYWHRKYGLTPETKILLCYGQTRPERGCIEIARSASNLPPGWRLVFHGPCTDRTEADILRAAAGAPVIVSRELIDFEQRDELIAGADVGLAIYKDNSQNDILTGSSSEKIALYLKWGCPVVACRYPSYEHLENEHCAYLIDGLSRIPDAVSAIERDLETRSRAARQCFENHYRADRNLERAVVQILAGAVPQNTR